MNLLAPHTMEIPFVMSHLDDCTSMTGPITESMRQLEAQASGAWVALARTGNPNHESLPDWPAYTDEDQVGDALRLAVSRREGPGRRAAQATPTRSRVATARAIRRAGLARHTGRALPGYRRVWYILSSLQSAARGRT